MNHHAFNWEPDLDRWRTLIRCVLPTIVHRQSVTAVGCSLSQPDMIYYQPEGTPTSVQAMRKKNKVPIRRTNKPRGWRAIYRDR